MYKSLNDNDNDAQGFDGIGQYYAVKCAWCVLYRDCRFGWIFNIKDDTTDKSEIFLIVDNTKKKKKSEIKLVKKYRYEI